MPALPSSSSLFLHLREVAPPIPASQATAHRTPSSNSSTTSPSHPLQHPPNNANTCTTPACKALLGILIPLTIATLFLSCWLIGRWWRGRTREDSSSPRRKHHKAWLASKIWDSRQRFGRKSAFAEKKRHLDLDEEWAVDQKQSRNAVLEVVRGSDRDGQGYEESSEAGGKGRASSVYSRTTDGDVLPDDDEEVQEVAQGQKEQDRRGREQRKGGNAIVQKLRAVRIRGKGNTWRVR